MRRSACVNCRNIFFREKARDDRSDLGCGVSSSSGCVRDSFTEGISVVGGCPSECESEHSSFVFKGKPALMKYVQICAFLFVALGYLGQRGNISDSTIPSTDIGLRVLLATTLIN